MEKNWIQFFTNIFCKHLTIIFNKIFIQIMSQMFAEQNENIYFYLLFNLFKKTRSFSPKRKTLKKNPQLKQLSFVDVYSMQYIIY